MVANFIKFRGKLNTDRWVKLQMHAIPASHGAMIHGTAVSGCGPIEVGMSWTMLIFTRGPLKATVASLPRMAFHCSNARAS